MYAIGAYDEIQTTHIWYTCTYHIISINQSISQLLLQAAWPGRGHVNHLNLGGHKHIPGTADCLRHCQHSSPVSVINF